MGQNSVIGLIVFYLSSCGRHLAWDLLVLNPPTYKPCHSEKRSDEEPAVRWHCRSSMGAARPALSRVEGFLLPLRFTPHFLEQNLREYFRIQLREEALVQALNDTWDLIF